MWLFKYGWIWLDADDFGRMQVDAGRIQYYQYLIEMVQSLEGKSTLVKLVPTLEEQFRIVQQDKGLYFFVFKYLDANSQFVQDCDGLCDLYRLMMFAVNCGIWWQIVVDYG